MKFDGKKIFVPDSANRLYNSNSKALEADKAILELRICPNSKIHVNTTNKLISFNDGYRASQNFSKVYEKNTANLINLISESIPKEKCIREIGCGDGTFLEQLRENGFRDLHGYDAACEKNKDLVTNRYLDDSDFPLNADAIILRHVIDDVPDPISFLNNILKINSKSFLLFMELMSFDQVVSMGRTWDLSNERINYFTESSLRKIFGSSIKRLDYTLENQNMLICVDFDTQLTTQLLPTRNNHKLMTKLKKSLNKQIKQLKKVLKTNNYIIWGGSSKGVTFSFFCTEQYGIKPPVGIIDSDPDRHGKFIHTSGVQILSPEQGLASLRDNDVLVISNPVYKDEILDVIKKNTHNKIVVINLP
tara:strand:- start:23901 stop:24986 length:1086 start_codon:yes stop_codon:yes gene_type:complete